MHDGKSCPIGEGDGESCPGFGLGSKADEGYFRNKLFISAANSTKGKMIDWI